MACACHGKSGIAVRKTLPDDQCTTCARKHVKNAYSKWGEFTYVDDNRDYVSGQLRDAADHLKYDHTEVALQCRDLAMVIEENRDKSIFHVAAELAILRGVTRDLYYADHPDAKERLDRLREWWERHEAAKRSA